jgi:hypothetical protein
MLARLVPRSLCAERDQMTHDEGFAVTDLVHHASDDQVALAICFGAVAFCGLVMYFSHHVGAADRPRPALDRYGADGAIVADLLANGAPAGAREKAA